MIFLKSLELWVFCGDFAPCVRQMWIWECFEPPPPPNLHLSSGNGVARLPGRNSGQKAQKGPQKKNFWPNFGWFYQKQAEKGPQKIFKRCSLFLAVITVINLIFNIQYTNFLRPLFCLFLVKSAKIRPEIFFSVAPFELFGQNFCLATLQHHFLNSSVCLG